DVIREVPKDRWNADSIYDPDLLEPRSTNTKYGGFLSDIARFDARFFGISPQEARAMDPQQRILLELTWTAYEHAGIRPSTQRGSCTGVFVGIGFNEYGDILFRNPDNFGAFSPAGAEISMAANRISHVFDLRGPSLTVNTGCSSALTAIHLAVASIRQGE